MAYRFRNGLSDLIFSTDSDMAALCGPSCLSISSFTEENTIKNKNKREKNDGVSRFVYNIGGGSNQLMEELKKYATTSLPSNQIIFTPARYPLLEETYYLTVALIVVGIGCDVLPGGISGVTPLSISKELKRIKEEGVPDNDNVKKCKLLMDFFKRKDKSNKMSNEEIRTYCEAFLFQPALKFGEKDNPQSYHYIFKKPGDISSYLQMFVPPTVDKKLIKNRCETLQCKGIGGVNLPHGFIKAEGHFTCSSCKACFCNTYSYSPSKDRDNRKTKTKSLVHYEIMNEDLCVDCYQRNIFLPHSITIDEVLTIEEMKSYLKKQNQSIVNDADAHEVQEFFEMQKELETKENDIDNHVPFPIYTSNELTTFLFGTIFHTFSFDQGGRFINDQKAIPNNLVFPVVDLIASLVRYNPKKIKYTEYKSPVYDVLPSLFIEFANKSRVGTGFRLLKRCLRHSFDPKANLLMERSASLFIDNKNNEVGLVLNNTIPASMKDAEYDVTTAFTKNDLIAAKCDCHAGGHENGRVVCVHTLPVLYQLVMLLDDGLAEHLLIELCSRLDSELEQQMHSDGKFEEMKKNIEILMRHNGESERRILNATSKLTIKDLLSTLYATGTERNKTCIPSQPESKKLKALKDIDLSSVVNKVKRRKKK